MCKLDESYSDRKLTPLKLKFKHHLTRVECVSKAYDCHSISLVKRKTSFYAQSQVKQCHFSIKLDTPLPQIYTYSLTKLCPSGEVGATTTLTALPPKRPMTHRCSTISQYDKVPIRKSWWGWASAKHKTPCHLNKKQLYLLHVVRLWADEVALMLMKSAIGAFKHQHLVNKA